MKLLMVLTFLLSAVAGGLAAQGRMDVLTVTPALAVLGQEIAPDGVSVSYPGPADENASDWEPGDDVLRLYQQADLVLLVGADYAGWVEKTALPRARLVETSAAFPERFISQASDVSDHQHGPTGAANHHTAFANHFWLDPGIARLQARAIADSFTALWPERADEIAVNLAELDRSLAEIGAGIGRELASLGGVNMLASHPVYQYLDEAFGLDLHNFHWEPDQHPKPEDWAEFDDKLAADQPNVMIWEADPLPETRSELSKRNVGIVVISPSPPEYSKGSLRARLGFPERIAPAK
ncbi:metal ABC transporter substrate-binding protein [Primorskyibacter sp. S87]|uniref:metal ABC transporter substrate-binding protein n=1 Tax=Primorskyibacter sp. S87 TaxID=3415126 RepID=UPI003C7C7E1D